MSNYSELWQRLLWTEEKQLEVDIREFDTTTTLSATDRRGFLVLQVPGLAENRPSVLKGDKVKVRLAGQRTNAWEGYAHHIQRDAVDLKFNPDFHNSYVNGQRVDVEFVINRTVMRLFLQGCRLAAQLPPQTLFPSEQDLVVSRARAEPMRNAVNAQLNMRRRSQRSSVASRARRRICCLAHRALARP